MAEEIVLSDRNVPRVPLQEELTKLYSQGFLTDITLSTEDGKNFEAHKVLLAARSHYFHSVVPRLKAADPVIFLKGVKGAHLDKILKFIYSGTVALSRHQLKPILEVAKSLQVKGLCDANPLEILQSRALVPARSGVDLGPASPPTSSSPSALSPSSASVRSGSAGAGPRDAGGSTPSAPSSLQPFDSFKTPSSGNYLKRHHQGAVQRSSGQTTPGSRGRGGAAAAMNGSPTTSWASSADSSAATAEEPEDSGAEGQPLKVSIDPRTGGLVAKGPAADSEVPVQEDRPVKKRRGRPPKSESLNQQRNNNQQQQQTQVKRQQASRSTRQVQPSQPTEVASASSKGTSTTTTTTNARRAAVGEDPYEFDDAEEASDGPGRKSGNSAAGGGRRVNPAEDAGRDEEHDGYAAAALVGAPGTGIRQETFDGEAASSSATGDSLIGDNSLAALQARRDHSKYATTSINGKQVLTVKCQNQTAELHLSRFANGFRGQSIRYRDHWMTPQEFEAECGSSGKKCMESIQTDYGPLKTLTASGLLKSHSRKCRCSICRGDIDPEKLALRRKNREQLEAMQQSFAETGAAGGAMVAGSSSNPAAAAMSMNFGTEASSVYNLGSSSPPCLLPVKLEKEDLAVQEPMAFPTAAALTTTTNTSTGHGLLMTVPDDLGMGIVGSRRDDCGAPGNNVLEQMQMQQMDSVHDFDSKGDGTNVNSSTTALGRKRKRRSKNDEWKKPLNDQLKAGMAAVNAAAAASVGINLGGAAGPNAGLMTIAGSLGQPGGAGGAPMGNGGGAGSLGPGPQAVIASLSNGFEPGNHMDLGQPQLEHHHHHHHQLQPPPHATPIHSFMDMSGMGSTAAVTFSYTGPEMPPKISSPNSMLGDRIEPPPMAQPPTFYVMSPHPSLAPPTPQHNPFSITMTPHPHHPPPPPSPQMLSPPIGGQPAMGVAQMHPKIPPVHTSTIITLPTTFSAVSVATSSSSPGLVGNNTYSVLGNLTSISSSTSSSSSSSGGSSSDTSGSDSSSSDTSSSDGSSSDDETRMENGSTGGGTEGGGGGASGEGGRSSKSSRGLVATKLGPVMNVRCKSTVAMLYVGKYETGSKGKCIQLGNEWLTPNEFEDRAGSKAKKYLSSIKCMGRPLRVYVNSGELKGSGPQPPPKPSKKHNSSSTGTSNSGTGHGTTQLVVKTTHVQPIAPAPPPPMTPQPFPHPPPTPTPTLAPGPPPGLGSIMAMAPPTPTHISSAPPVPPNLNIMMGNQPPILINQTSISGASIIGSQPVISGPISFTLAQPLEMRQNVSQAM